MFKINLVKLLGPKKQDCCDVQIIEAKENDGSENEQDDKCCAK